MKPHEMNATDAVESIRQGELSAEAMVVDCLERIELREPKIRAWVHLDPERAEQVERTDCVGRTDRAALPEPVLWAIWRTEGRGRGCR